jgi:hypothetical protein
MMPRSGPADTLEKAACAGQRAEGYMMALDTIEQMATPSESSATAVRFVKADPNTGI